MHPELRSLTRSLTRFRRASLADGTLQRSDSN